MFLHTWINHDRNCGDVKHHPKSNHYTTWVPENLSQEFYYTVALGLLAQNNWLNLENTSIHWEISEDLILKG